MLKLERGSLLIIIVLAFVVCPEENDRAGVYFGTSICPGFSYSLVSPSLVSMNYGDTPTTTGASFTKLSGMIGAGLQLGISKNGYNIHSIQAAFSGYFPTGKFLGAITSGYSFAHYLKTCAPSMALGFEVDNYFRINGFNETPVIPPVQIGFKAGYEIRRHLTCWIGYLLSFEQYDYIFKKTAIDRMDGSNTIRALGEFNVHEFIFANRFQISLSYLFY
jgi:hypothetical protein